MTRCEKEVADVLKDLGIKWSYEHPIFVWDENKRPRIWTPDFSWLILEFILRYVVQKNLIMNIERRSMKRDTK